MELKEHKPISASERDRLSPVWDMSQERMFIENLLCQRFNYFLIFFSITIAGFSGAKNVWIGEAILIFGAIITTMFANVLRWNQKKLNFIIEDLHTDESHPSKIIDDMVGKNRRKFMGIYIPTLCSVSIICASIINLVYLIFFK